VEERRADLNGEKAAATAKEITQETGNPVRGIGCIELLSAGTFGWLWPE
jgi:hypothetical protein